MNLRLAPKLNYLNKLYSVKERMNFYDVPGVSIAVIKDFNLLDTFSYGIKDIKTKEKITKNTLFQAASISKPITSLIIFRLLEKGVLDLNKDINLYLNDFKIIDLHRKKVSVTIRELLSHTAGISISGVPGYSVYEKLPTIDNILKGIYPSKTNAIIKEFNDNSFHYSGGGYLIIQEIIENITKKKFKLVAEEELFKVLKLRASTFGFISNKHNFSSGHRLNKRVNGKFHLYPEKAAGGLWSTPKDLSMIFIELLNIYNNNKSNNLLSKESVLEIMTPFKEALGGHTGMGLMIRKINKNNYFWFGGWNEGFQSKFIFNLDKGFGVIAMSNSDKGIGLIYEMFTGIAKKYKWRDLEDYIF